ncbi:hypothetical protein ACTJJB_01525 [Chitinophaga sp. 22536]|uniref:hypothetical protein n=1 Tax=unclassified Chitinophaga TaxID=2619133 RepID=UPI003F84C252
MDLLYKIIQDSGVENANAIPLSGQKYTYDDELVTDANVYRQMTLSGVIYATNFGNNGNVLAIVDQNPNGNTNPNQNPSNPWTPPNPTTSMYQKTSSTSYTAGNNGETLITLTDINGNPLTGKNILQIELETKPLKATEYIWNPNISQVSIPKGMFKGQTIFVLYQEMITA